MGGFNKKARVILSLVIIIFSIFVSASEVDETRNTQVKECPKDFGGYKEEYGISENEFKEIFDSCYTPNNEELLEREIREGKVEPKRPGDEKYDNVPPPPGYKIKERKLPSNLNRLSKDVALNYIKANKDKIKWIKQAKSWDGVINKTSFSYPTNTIKYYIHLFKKAIYSRYVLGRIF